MFPNVIPRSLADKRLPADPISMAGNERLRGAEHKKNFPNRRVALVPYKLLASYLKRFTTDMSAHDQNQTFPCPAVLFQHRFHQLRSGSDKLRCKGTRRKGTAGAVRFLR